MRFFTGLSCCCLCASALLSAVAAHSCCLHPGAQLDSASPQQRSCLNSTHRHALLEASGTLFLSAPLCFSFSSGFLSSFCSQLLSSPLVSFLSSPLSFSSALSLLTFTSRPPVLLPAFFLSPGGLELQSDSYSARVAASLSLSPLSQAAALPHGSNCVKVCRVACLSWVMGRLPSAHLNPCPFLPFSPPLLSAFLDCSSLLPLP